MAKLAAAISICQWYWQYHGVGGAWLDGKPTGVFASQLTVPHHAVPDDGTAVDVVSPEGRPEPGWPDLSQAGTTRRSP